MANHFVSSGIVEFATDNAIEDIERILRFGPECIDECDSEGMTALHWACVCGYETLASLLIDKGANVNTFSGATSTPIQDAARNGVVSIVAKLIEKGADLNVKDRDGNTVLHEAARNNATEIVTLCLDAGLSIDAQTIAGNTPLHYACMWGALDTLAILIDRGAAMNITNNADKSALDVMLSINDAARAKVAAVYNERLLARRAFEEEEQQRLDAQRVDEARAQHEAKKRELALKKQARSDQGAYSMILNRKKSQAQQQRISVLEKEADLSMRLNKQAYVNFVDEDDYLPEGKLPPIKKALSQKSISSPTAIMIPRRKKFSSPKRASVLLSKR